MKQPTDLHFYRGEDGVTAVSVSLTSPPRENGIAVREEIYIPAVGWFKESINDLYEALIELAQMTDEEQPDDGEGDA